jgi:hypothetical protein
VSSILIYLYLDTVCTLLGCLSAFIAAVSILFSFLDVANGKDMTPVIFIQISEFIFNLELIIIELYFSSSGFGYFCYVVSIAPLIQMLRLIYQIYVPRKLVEAPTVIINKEAEVGEVLPEENKV